ncbi:unnamed protein product [Ilex paraguariensis]|uniref:Uncharacterized protein n=1 Tax=Ilex paraguariensis TaxID=185542 RepID=A0ABC8RV61_9AQUA
MPIFEVAYYSRLYWINHASDLILQAFLGIGDLDQNKADALKVEDSKSSLKCIINFFLMFAVKEENVYLGAHGAPPLESKQQEMKSSSHKQRFKQKLKEADQRYSGIG